MAKKKAEVKKAVVVKKVEAPKSSSSVISKSINIDKGERDIKE